MGNSFDQVRQQVPPRAREESGRSRGAGLGVARRLLTVGGVPVIPHIFQMTVFRPQVLEAAARARADARAASFAQLLEQTAALPSGEQVALPRPGVLDPWLRHPVKRALASDIENASRSAAVDPRLAVAVAVAESSLDSSARSRDGLSAGTFQVTDTTEAEIRRKLASGRLERPAGRDDVALGVAYLRYLDEIFHRSTALGRGLETEPVLNTKERRRFTAAAFNAGEGRVASAQHRARASGGDPTRYADVRPYLPSITRTYVDRVMRYSGEPGSGEPA